jgi:hypothetical protein
VLVCFFWWILIECFFWVRGGLCRSSRRLWRRPCRTMRRACVPASMPPRRGWR